MIIKKTVLCPLCCSLWAYVAYVLMCSDPKKITLYENASNDDNWSRVATLSETRTHS